MLVETLVIGNWELRIGHRALGIGPKSIGHREEGLRRALVAGYLLSVIARQMTND